MATIRPLILLWSAVAGAQISNTGIHRLQFSRERNCTWIKHVADPDQLQHHERSVLESCLYYHLQERSSGSPVTGARLSPSPLEVLPPVPFRQRVSVEIQKFTLRRVVVDEAMSKAIVMASLLFSWKDPRVQWSVDEWKIPELEFRWSSSLWTPDVFPSRSPTFQVFGYANTRRIIAKSDGNVSARSEIHAQSHCAANYDQFPNDRQTCCFNLYSPSTRNSILYQLSDDPSPLGSYLDPMFAVSASWKLDNVRLTTDLDEGTSSKNQHLRICLDLVRNSPTLRTELTLPVAVSGLISVLAPLTGDLRCQLMVKLYVLLLQLLSFQFLVQRTPSDGLAMAFPRIYLFYDYTIGTTIINIFISLLIFGLSQRKRLLPPHRILIHISKRINRLLFCCTKDPIIDSSEIDSAWTSCFMALNALMNSVILISYLIGVLIVFIG